ncbi:MAG: L-fuconolactonase [Gaiellaceae bacterium]|nr:L-fuconolactonase [Gaiellaceae bacterium]
MEIIDSQIHEPKTAAVWPDADAEVRAAVACEIAIAAMDAVGVDLALLDGSPAFNRMALERYRDRFRAVGRLDHEAPDLLERVAEIKSDVGLLALRCVLFDWQGGTGTAALREGRFDPLFNAAARADLPVFAFVNDATSDLSLVAARFPELRLIVDHLGLTQPPVFRAAQPPFAKLDDLLALATFENVAVKFSGAPTLSETPFPHEDLWPHLHRIVESFGVGRLMWASDFTRLRMVSADQKWAGLYSDAVGFLRDTPELSLDEKKAIFGGTVRTWLRWV